MRAFQHFLAGVEELPQAVFRAAPVFLGPVEFPDRLDQAGLQPPTVLREGVDADGLLAQPQFLQPLAECLRIGIGQLQALPQPRVFFAQRGQLRLVRRQNLCRIRTSDRLRPLLKEPPAGT